MFSAIRRRLNYTNAAVTLALVFAMSGGAYAAGRYVITSTKQIKPSVLKALKSAGAKGETGPAGAKGETGPAGVKGETGPAGAKGETGPAGAKGETGAEGKEGKEGSPWTAGGTLPSGKTETGAWLLSSPEKGNFFTALSSISFPIKLEERLGEGEVHYVGESGNGTTCPGSAVEPSAAAGNLCVYQTFAFGVEEEGGHAKASIFSAGVTFYGTEERGAATSGALVSLSRNAEEAIIAWGTWAVTAK